MPKSQIKESKTKQWKNTNEPSISNTPSLRKYNKITENQFNAIAKTNQEQGTFFLFNFFFSGFRIYSIVFKRKSHKLMFIDRTTEK